ncbi:MAG: hypothetical protein ACNA8W_15705 [Bradymonadaceae bacterium]
MKKSNEELQLDLTAAVTDVPQANSLALFIRFMGALRSGRQTVEELAESLGVEVRTVQYYADFGRWITFVQPASGATLALTETGLVFAESVPARGRLFSAGLFAKRLVQTVQSLKRDALEAEGRELDTQEACLRAIRAMTDLAESTAERRASALASMLQWAYKPSAVDWTSGEPNEEARATFDFQGQSFLTAMGARRFGLNKAIHVAFPRQVLIFARDHARGLHAAHWIRASYEVRPGSATWFGSVPTNPSTLAVAERGGPDLRRLLVLCAPYVSILVAMLTLRDAARRPLVRLTSDMYGPQLWYREAVLGPPLQVIEDAARALDLVPVHSVPHLERRHSREDLSMGDDAALCELLIASGIVRLRDTALELAPGFEDALRQSNEATSSIAERLQILQPTLQEWLRDQP